MKKIIIILSVLFCTSAIYSQTFKEFFANNSIDGNLNSKYYSIGTDDSLIMLLSNRNLTDLEGLDTLSIKNRSIADFNTLELFLRNNQLTSLPEEISKLTNLQTLSLSNNQLTSLPEEISKLTNLQELSLSNNQLKSVPEEISKLTNLWELHLSSNQLTSLPDSIGNLKQLGRLNISENKLTSLPTNAANLTNLRGLFLNNNNLAALPNFICNFNYLIHLNVSNNQLTSLPGCIEKLQNLQSLFLQNNKLVVLPDIGSLGNLTLLNLYNNKLTSLPDSIGNLTKLEELYLNSNQLTSLPNSMDKLTNLWKLNLNNNPLTTMPLNLLKKPPIQYSSFPLLKNLQYSLNDTPLGAALYYRKLKNTGISDSRLQPILVSSFYHNYYENEKLNLSDFRSSFALELIKNISSLLKVKTPKAGSYNPMSKMTLPRTIIKEQFNKQRTKKRKFEETEPVEYQLPPEIIRNIYNYLD